MSAHPNFAGSWVQDKARSDKDDEAFELIEAGFMLRKGVLAVSGLEIEIVPEDYFQFAIVTIVPFFKIKEKYPLGGDAAEHKRRDMRSGKSTGRFNWSEDGKEMVVSLEWTGELAGSGTDTYKLISENELHIIHTLTNKNGNSSARKVYIRKK